MCPRLAKFVSDEVEIPTQGEEMGKRTKDRKKEMLGVKDCPSCSLQDLKIVFNSKKTCKPAWKLLRLRGAF